MFNKADFSSASSDFENEVQILQTANGATINFNLDEAVTSTISLNNVLGQQIASSLSVEATTQTVKMDIPYEQEETFNIRFPRALERVKTLAEKK